MFQNVEKGIGDNFSDKIGDFDKLWRTAETMRSSIYETSNN